MIKEIRYSTRQIFPACKEERESFWAGKEYSDLSRVIRTSLVGLGATAGKE